jgi:lysophospholipase L1-like esterase
MDRKLASRVFVFSIIIGLALVTMQGKVSGAGPDGRANPPKRPNIIFILTDDLATNLVIRGISPERFVHVVGSSRKTSVKIMPLGDSITFGWPDRSYGGYQHFLWTLLTNDGYTIEFVGSQRRGNEGHPGWTIAQIKKGIDSNGWLETYQPDIILLHIGTNDIRQGKTASAPGNLSALLDDILMRLPRAQVIVAQIIPFRRGSDPDHQSYNASIPGIVTSKGPRVSMVDMQSILSKSDYADDIHPNADGYDKMARAWEPAINAIFSSSAQHVDAQPPPNTSSDEGVKPLVPSFSQGKVSVSIIRYVPSSAIKVEKLIGDVK